MQKVVKRHEFMEQFRNSDIQFLAGFKKSILTVASIIADHLPNPFPSYTKIMKDGFIKNRNTVANAIKFLKQYGFIRVSKLGKNNHYHLFKIDINNIKLDIKTDTKKILISNKGVNMNCINSINQYQLSDTNLKKFSQNNEYQNTSISTLVDNRTSINNDTLSINQSINTKVPNRERNTYLSNQYYSIKINTNTDTNKKIDTDVNIDTHTLKLTNHIIQLSKKLDDISEFLNKTNARIDKLGLRQNEMNALLTTIEIYTSHISSNQQKQQRQMINLAPALASRFPVNDKPQVSITDIEVSEFMPSKGSINLLKEYFNSSDEQVYQQIQAFRAYVKDKITDPNHKINNLQTYFERAVTNKWAVLEINKEATKSFKEQDIERTTKLKQQIRGMREAVEAIKNNQNNAIEGLTFLNDSNDFIEYEEIPTTEQILEKRKNYHSDLSSVNNVLAGCLSKVLVKGEVYA